MGKKIKLQKSKNSSFNQNHSLSSLKINPKLLLRKEKSGNLKQLSQLKKVNP